MAELVSTRDPANEVVTYSEALISGLAPGGGLYVPPLDQYPEVSTDELRKLSGQTYQTIFNFVKTRLIGGEIDTEDQQKLTAAAYNPEKFPKAVDGNLTPVEQIGDELYLQNLSLGPTAAFKDMALQVLAQDIDYTLGKQGKELTILGATSGDTGSAAEAAFKGLGRTSLFMLSPETGMSDFQKGQMGALTGDNIVNISVRGRFDDCQNMVKAVKQDPEFADLGAVNSINWGRIVAQVPYYFAGYLQVVGKDIGKEVDFAVPTGNFGNIFSGHVARKMGLPIGNLIAATNENNVVHNLISTGNYITQPTSVTSSPSMDISKASNYERLLYEMLEGKAETVGEYMREFEQTERAVFKDYGLAPSFLQAHGFLSGTSTRVDRLEAIRNTYRASKTIIDPHTADGVGVVLNRRSDPEQPKRPTVCLATALPVKFEATIKEALGSVPLRDEQFQGIESQQSDEDFIVIGNSVEALKKHLRALNK